MALQTFSTEDWTVHEGRFWVNFFNTLSGARTPVLIGTEDAQGTSNLGLFNSLVHLGATPPLLGFILRPTTVPRHTYNNLKASGSYTINHVSKSILDQAHQTSAKYEESESEFKATGLDEEWIEGSSAPFVKQSPIKLGMQFREEHLVLNGTRLIVGEVTSVMLDEATIKDDGSIDLVANQAVSVSGLYRYHDLKFLEQKDYARPTSDSRS